MASDASQRAAQPADQSEAERPIKLNLPGQGFEKLAGQMWSNIRAAPSELGTTLTAAFKQGAKDLRNFFADPWGGGQQVEEPNMPLNTTPLEAYEQKHHDLPRQEMQARDLQSQVKGYAVESPFESKVKGVTVDPAEPVRPMDTPGMNPLEQFRNRKVQPSREREIAR